MIASNVAGLATNSGILTVIVPPGISVQPVSLVVTNTQSASFSVTASGVPAPWYQWNKNGVPISSAVNNTATNATFNIASTSSGDIATYSVTISNAAGTVTSSPASLNVNPPTVGPALATTTVLGNGSVQFSISGPAGSAGFTYRVWASTNLALAPVTSTWTLLTNDTFGISPTVFTDSDASGLPQWYYIITVP